MIEILIRKGAHIFNSTADIFNKIKSDLTFDNPKYINAKRYGKFASDYLEPKLYFFSYNQERNIIYIPRGYIFYLLKSLKERKIEYKLTDKTTLFPQMDLTFLGKARDYQMDAIRAAIKYPVGIIESGTGSGKTVMGINIISIRKQPTMILVHTKELLHQWDKRIQEFLGYKPGIVGDGVCEVKDISIGIVQSVQNRIEDLKDRFGHVICDECHRVSSATWTDIMSQFSARYYLGLSATAYRADGLGHALYAFIGPKIYTVDKEVLHDTGAVLKPVIIRKETDFYHFHLDYGSTVSALASNQERNRVIAKTVQQDIAQFNSSVLIASDRVNHCHLIQDELERLKIDSVVLTGGGSKKERESIIEGVSSGKHKVLISTIQLIGEGFDAPNIHGLFIVTPIKFSGRLLQIAGRILRPEKGKTARLYDFRDSKINILRKMGRSRDKIYEAQWGR